MRKRRLTAKTKTSTGGENDFTGTTPVNFSRSLKAFDRRRAKT
jgi:hypothetical protein